MKRFWRVAVLALPLVLLAIVAYQNARRPQHLAGLDGEVVAIAYAPQSADLACYTGNLQVQLWRPNSEKWRVFGKALDTKNGDNQLFDRLQFSSDGSALYSGGQALNRNAECAFNAWSVPSGELQYSFGSTLGPAFDISRDNHWAAGVFFDAIIMFDLTRRLNHATRDASAYNFPENYRFFRTDKWTHQPQIPGALRFAPDSKTLASWDGVSDVRLHQLTTGKVLRQFSWPLSQTTNMLRGTALEWSPDGRYLAACDGVQLQIWNANGSSAGRATVPAMQAASGIRPPVLT